MIYLNTDKIPTSQSNGRGFLKTNRFQPSFTDYGPREEKPSTLTGTPATDTCTSRLQSNRRPEGPVARSAEPNGQRYFRHNARLASHAVPVSDLRPFQRVTRRTVPRTGGDYPQKHHDAMRFPNLPKKTIRQKAYATESRTKPSMPRLRDILVCAGLAMTIVCIYAITMWWCGSIQQQRRALMTEDEFLEMNEADQQVWLNDVLKKEDIKKLAKEMKIELLDDNGIGNFTRLKHKISEDAKKKILKPKRVFIIRHGKSVFNEFESQIKATWNWLTGENAFNFRDTPLSATGIKECKTAYEAIFKKNSGLGKYLTTNLVKYFCSPLTRAAVTLLLMNGLHDPEATLPTMIALPNASERCNTNPNDSEGTPTSSLIRRYAAYSGKFLAAETVMAQPAREKIIRQKMDFSKHKVEDWWPKQITSPDKPVDPKWEYQMSRRRYREKESTVQQRIRSVMIEIMKSEESDIVIAGHSHFFKELIKSMLHIDTGVDQTTRTLYEAHSNEPKKKMKNTEVLMIDFTGEMVNGRYKISNMKVVYDPVHPDEEVKPDVFQSHPCGEPEKATRQAHKLDGEQGETADPTNTTESDIISYFKKNDMAAPPLRKGWELPLTVTSL